MSKMPIGQLFRSKREALGWSQAKTCEGICSVPTLSRIENDNRMPSERCVRALMDRLGIVDNRGLIPQDPYEEELEALQTEVRACVIQFTRAAAEDKPALREEALRRVEELEAFADKDDFMVRQRLVGDRLSLGKAEGPYSRKETVVMLLEALRLTIPSFDLKRINSFRYSMEEAKLVNQIAAAYARDEDWETALSIYRQLLTYLRENLPPSSRYAGQQAMVAANYARELAACERHEEAIAVAEEGHQICISYGRYQYLPMLLALLANCHAHLGHRAESQRLYERAFILYDELGEKGNLAHLRKDAKDTLGVELFDDQSSSQTFTPGSGNSS